MRWCASSTSSTRCLIGFIAHLLARTIRIEEDLVDQLFSSSENGWRESCCCSRGTAEHDKQQRSRPGDLPGDAGGNGRHDAIAREFLYEEDSSDWGLSTTKMGSRSTSLLTVVLHDKDTRGLTGSHGRASTLADANAATP
jgi:hypothetical protein